MMMSTKLKVASTIALLAVLAAPGAVFAQQAEAPSDQNVSAAMHRRAPRDGNFGGAYGYAPGYQQQERVYEPNYQRNINPFSSGYPGFQGQRSG